jgi:hypothetical protein
MTLGTMKAGDIVVADRKGRRFFAVVTERREYELEVEPIDRRVTYHLVKPREVIGIWHKRRAQNGRAVAAVRSTAWPAKRAGTLARSQPRARPAAVLLGGPYGEELRGEQFKRARAYVAGVFGELT